MEADLKYSYSPRGSGHKSGESIKIGLPTTFTVDFRYNYVVNSKALDAAPMAAYATIAQLVEHLICNQGVAGSIPAGGSQWKKIFLR